MILLRPILAFVLGLLLLLLLHQVSALNTECTSAQALTLNDGAATQIALVSPQSDPTIPAFSTIFSCHSDVTFLGTPTRWFQLTGTGSLVTVNVEEARSGSSIVVFDATGFPSMCSSTQLGDRCIMYGYDTISFTGVRNSSYLVAIANVTSTNPVLTVTFNVSNGSDAPLPDPAQMLPLPDPLPMDDVLPVLPIPTFSGCISATPLYLHSDSSSSEGRNYSLTALERTPSICTASPTYSRWFSVQGDGRVLQVDVCTHDASWLAEIEVAKPVDSTSVDPCAGADCIAESKVFYDVTKCGSSLSGRLSRAQFLSQPGVSYYIAVSSVSPITSTLFDINVTSVPSAPNSACGSAALILNLPAIVSGNTETGGPIGRRCNLTDSSAASLGQKSLWFKLNGGGSLLRVSPCGERNTLMARVVVFEQAGPVSGNTTCGAALTCVGAASCFDPTDGVEFMAKDGHHYHIGVAGQSPSEAGFFEMIVEERANDTLTERRLPIRHGQPLQDYNILAQSNTTHDPVMGDSLLVGSRQPNMEPSKIVIEFEVPAFDPTSVTENGIASAYVRFYGGVTGTNAPLPQVRVTIHQVNRSEITERSFNSIAPSELGPELDAVIVSDTFGFYEFDVFDAVKYSTAGHNVFFLLHAHSEANTTQSPGVWATFYSRESPAIMHRPHLAVTYFQPQPRFSNRMPAVGDTYVLSDPQQISHSYGSELTLRVADGPHSGDEAITYVQFPLVQGNDKERGTDVQLAFLRLKGSSSSPDGNGLYVSAASAGDRIWNEKTFVFRNRIPAIGYSEDSTPIGPYPNRYYEWNVTDAVKDVYRSNKQRISFALFAQGQQPTANGAKFDSRESDIASQRPQLIVHFQ